MIDRPCGQYWLHREVFWCCPPRWHVFLDRAHDRYVSVARSNADEYVAHLDESAPALLKAGILTTDPGLGKPALPTTCVAPARDLKRAAWVMRRRVSTRTACIALRSLARTARAMDQQPLVKTLNAVQSQRSRLDRAPTDVVELRRHMADFQAMRPWYPRAYRCLFDSLAALNYLARCGFAPLLVFGVQAEPFEAHCWVQQGDAVVNDTLDRVQAFTPIMVV